MSKGFEVIVLSEIVKPLEGPLQRFFERNWHVGIFASMSGFTISLLSLAKVLSVILGFGGALFGFVAGYYTMRSARRKWLRQKAEDAAKKAADEETTL